MSTMITIAETGPFQKKVTGLLTADERKLLIDYLAQHPKAGDLIKGTGGVRKLRWAKQCSGKSGGVRVIYYYYDDDIPLFLLALFGKNEKANLSKLECNELKKLTTLLVKQYNK